MTITMMTDNPNVEILENLCHLMCHDDIGRPPKYWNASLILCVTSSKQSSFITIQNIIIHHGRHLVDLLRPPSKG